MNPTSAPAPDRRWWSLGQLLAANVLVFASVTIVNVALPAIQAELGLDATARQGVVTVYAVSFGALMLLGGGIADRVGLRRCLVVGLLGFGATSLAGGLATTTTALLLARAAQGAAGALVAATALGSLSALFPSGPDRARAFGALGVVMGIGTAGSFLLGGAFVDLLTWRWCLLVNVPCALVIIVGLLRTPSAPPGDHGRRPIDVRGTTLATGAVACLVFGFDRVSALGWTHPLPLGLVSVGVSASVWFVRRSRRVAHPVVPPRIVGDRERAGAFVAVAGVGFGMFAGMFLLGSFLQDVRHHSAVVVGLALLPFGLSATAVSRWAGRWRTRVGPRPLLGTGLGLVALALTAFVGLGPDAPLVATLPTTLLLGAGGTLVMVVGAETATRGTAPDSGVAGSLVNSVQQLGAALGTALFAAIIGAPAGAADHFSSYARAATVGAVLLIIIAAAVLKWPSPRLQQVRTPDARHTGRR